MSNESQHIASLFEKLVAQPKHFFPTGNERLNVPSMPGVYVIYDQEAALHVGRSVRGKKGLRQRLMNHLHGSSSFTVEYLKGNGAMLRDRKHTFQYLEVEDQRSRALLEAYAIGVLCPKHLGLGSKQILTENF